MFALFFTASTAIGVTLITFYLDYWNWPFSVYHASWLPHLPLSPPGMHPSLGCKKGSANRQTRSLSCSTWFKSSHKHMIESKLLTYGYNILCDFTVMFLTSLICCHSPSGTLKSGTLLFPWHFVPAQISQLFKMFFFLWMPFTFIDL